MVEMMEAGPSANFWSELLPSVHRNLNVCVCVTETLPVNGLALKVTSSGPAGKNEYHA